MKSTYSQIWKYLEGKLSGKEEDELMGWIGESERNSIFFDQVVQDFNDVNRLSPVQNYSFNWYWRAAAVFILISGLLWIFKTVDNVESVRTYKLADGSEVTTNESAEFVYDSASFDETKWIKIIGTAEVKTKRNEHLLVETKNGFLILNGMSTLQMKVSENNDLNITVFQGSISWLNPRATGEEFTMLSGENAVFKNDGKTILINSYEKRHKTVLIFDNYMNL